MDDRQHFFHTLFDGGFGFLADLQTKTDVLCNGHIREECIGLKDHAYIALIGSLVGNILITEQ